MELLELPEREIVSADGWQDYFWQHVGERCALKGAEVLERYLCSSGYVYSGAGRDLRSFDPGGSDAESWRDALRNSL